jgi:hypothetical protein
LLHRGIRRLSDCQCGVVAGSTAVEVVMARFRVELAQSIVETAVVYVEATNAQQAEELALEWAGTGEPVEAGPVKVIADWRFKRPRRGGHRGSQCNGAKP